MATIRRGFLVQNLTKLIATHFTIMSGSTRPLAIAITMIGIRFYLSRLIYFVQIRMLNRIITGMPLLFIGYRADRLIFLRCSTHRIFLRFHQTIYSYK